MTSAWDEVRQWRRSTRTSLLQRRIQLSQAERRRRLGRIEARIAAEVPELHHAIIGFYWPFKAEIDLRPLVRACLKRGAAAALPVVVTRGQALEFWTWQPRCEMGRGIWDIPVPAKRRAVRPTALLVPLVGFDLAGYRLGYGGGYYDRTLADMVPRPLTIGVGFEFARLDSIHPQRHDIPLDMIVTEESCRRHRYRGTALDPILTTPPGYQAAPGYRAAAAVDEEPGYASPPCFLHELDPSYLGFLSGEEQVGLLQDLQQAASGNAATLLAILQGTTKAAEAAQLRDLALDEAHCAKLLSDQIVGQTGEGRSSHLAGQPLAEAAREEAPDGTACLAKIACAMAERASRLEKTLPRIGDRHLQARLRQVLDLARLNLDRCRSL